jgi:hypothetical protein
MWSNLTTAADAWSEYLVEKRKLRGVVSGRGVTDEHWSAVSDGTFKPSE